VLASLLAGLGLGLSLIVAIGAQNAFVLRQGLRREHVLPVVIVCALSDAVLIAAGVAGAGWVFERLPWFAEIMRWAGAAFLVGYAIIAARRAIRPKALVAAGDVPPTSLRTTVLTVLALTWLNPHVYLDTLVLLGSIAGGHGDLRWWFAVGAMIASIAWFATLGFGARLLGPLFARPVAWRILDAIIAVIMLTIALQLVLGPH
jgi:L-lysine exporter family protein LysE/ArgO